MSHISQDKLLKLNLGCGLIAPEGWVNIDNSLSALLAKHTVLRAILRSLRLLPSEILDRKWLSNIYFHDIRKGLPFHDGSAAYVYVANLIHSLSYQETHKLLKEIRRVLVPGGVLRIVELNVLEIIRQYVCQVNELESRGETGLVLGQSPADKLAKRLGFRVPAARHTFLRRYLGKSKMRRAWLWDAQSIKMYMESCGFVCSLKGARDSRIPDIDVVEQDPFLDTFSIEGEKHK